ncbi:MAG: type VI secretion system baseplate subunit TssF [Telluria sp.]|nr:type VI secretion system baseplate subunit TssF [Telluria sp.]
MKTLLPYVERELAILREYMREFARQYPRLAGKLGMRSGVCEDVHIERWIEATAILNARIALKLSGNYPEFTEAMLNVNYPHYMQPFPSASTIRFDYSGARAGKMDAVTHIPRGTVMNSAEQQGVICRFRTIYDTVIAPVALSQVRFDSAIKAPAAIGLPSGATAMISIDIEGFSSTMGLAQLGLKSLRVCIDGEQPLCATLRDVLFMHVSHAYVEVGNSGRWNELGSIPIAAVGFALDEGLIPFKATSHPAYRLLTEYFSFPEKFNFFDIDLAVLAAFLPVGGQRLALHLAVSGVRADSDTARALASLSSRNLLLACTPVINLFRQQAVPIGLTHAKAEYELVADAGPAIAYDIHSIDAVSLLRESPDGSSLTQFHPYYSLRHGLAGSMLGHYFMTRRDDMLAVTEPGHETRISFVDVDINPCAIENATASIVLTCTNRDLPSRLSIGLPAGDLTTETPTGGFPIRFLRKPTPTYRFPGAAHWRLIAHLSLNHRSLVHENLEAFTELLTLYDLPQSAVSQRQIRGIVGLAQKPARFWLDDDNGGAPVHGIEIRISVDEDAFVGSGLHMFAQVIDHFLGLYVHVNSFTRLIVLSQQTGMELLRCRPRSGDMNLA